MSEDTKYRILQAASKVFGKFGYAKANIDDIAGEAGVASATLYHYFKNKEEIFLTIVRDEARDLESCIDQAVAKAETPQQKLEVFFVTQYRHLFENINFYNLTQEQLLGFHPLIFKGLKEFNSYRTRKIREIVQEGIEKKIFKPLDMDLLIEAIQDLNKGAFMRLRIQKRNFDVEKYINFLFTIIFKGIELERKGK